MTGPQPNFGDLNGQTPVIFSGSKSMNHLRGCLSLTHILVYCHQKQRQPQHSEVTTMARRSFWAWGMESEEPTLTDQRQAAERLSNKYGVTLEAVPAPRSSDLNLRKPRITPPAALQAICSTDDHDRAVHTYASRFVWIYVSCVRDKAAKSHIYSMKLYMFWR